MIRRHSIGIDYLLRDHEHAISIKLTRRHLVTLYDVESQRGQVFFWLNA